MSDQPLAPPMSSRFLHAMAKVMLLTAGLHVVCNIGIALSGDAVNWSQQLKLPASMLFLAGCLFLLAKQSRKGDARSEHDSQ